MGLKVQPPKHHYDFPHYKELECQICIYEDLLDMALHDNNRRAISYCKEVLIKLNKEKNDNQTKQEGII